MSTNDDVCIRRAKVLMSNLVDLAGNPIAEAPEPNRVVEVLKRLLAQIESGELDVQSIYILAEAADPHSRARVLRISRDSGMTVAEAVFRLEMEKATVIDMMLSGTGDAD